MSKKGRQRRTPEQRDAAKDRRSTLGYLQRIQREVAAEKWKKLIAEMSQPETPVSETPPDTGSK